MAVWVVIVAALAVLVGFAVWSQQEGRDAPSPMIALKGECPLCGHRVRDHRGGRTMSGIRAGCTLEHCQCDAPIAARWWR